MLIQNTLIIGVIIQLIFGRPIAIHKAKAYLSQKYTQEMKYKYTRHYWIDPALYHVYFSPLNNPEILFEVLINSDLTLQEGRTNQYGHYEPDNYLLRIFQFQIHRILKTKLQEMGIWDKDVNIYVFLEHQPLYSFKVPIELNEQMSAKDIEPYIDYGVSIHVDYFLEEAIDGKEANNILRVFTRIKELGFKPNVIRFSYKIENNEDSRKVKIKYFKFENWAEIESIQQIMAQKPIKMPDL